MELKTVKDALDSVAEKQKLCDSNMQEPVDRLSQESDMALNMIREAPTGPDNLLYYKSVVVDLEKTIKDVAASSNHQLEASEKELLVAFSKCQKAVEKTQSPDISVAYRNVEFDPHSIHQIIAQFFYRQGMFDIADMFISETGEPEPESSATKTFLEMNMILEAMKKRDLGPALKWVVSNSDKLKQANSDLELKLHSLHFLGIAKDKNFEEAINYARKHMALYSDSYLPEIQKLMGSLLWIRNPDKSPYAEFLSPALWTKAAKELTQQYCKVIGESLKSPLLVTVEAGSQALPTFLEYLNVMPNKRREWQKMEQLLVPVELSEEYRFHSVFVCPVSVDQSSESNPPMRLCCGHILCKQCIAKMPRSESNSFKCPYCPAEMHDSQCQQLYF